MTWTAAVLLMLGVAGQRLFGMFVAGSLLARRPLSRAFADLVPVAVVAALVAQLTFTRAGSLEIDARLAGMAVAAFLVWRRAPFAVVVVAAAATAAGLRAF